MNNLKLLITIVTVFLSTYVSAQEFQDQLEAIVITNNNNDIQVINDEIKSKDFNLKKAIKASRDLDNIIEVPQDTAVVQLSKKSYLKIIRKSVNKSADSVEFLHVLSEELPQLEDLICNDASFKELYNAVRPSTFNGKLDELPSIL